MERVDEESGKGGEAGRTEHSGKALRSWDVLREARRVVRMRKLVEWGECIVVGFGGWVWCWGGARWSGGSRRVEVSEGVSERRDRSAGRGMRYDDRTSRDPGLLYKTGDE